LDAVDRSALFVRPIDCCREAALAQAGQRCACRVRKPPRQSDQLVDARAAIPLKQFDGHCHVAVRRRERGLRLTDFQAAATASRHVVIAAARSTARGEAIAIIETSGSGKSTLIRLINRLETISEGEIFIDGTPTAGFTGRRLRELRTEIGFVFQQFNLYGHLNALDNVSLALRKVRGMPRAKAEARAHELLERVGLADKARQYPAQLSGGQQHRVAIARALATDPKTVRFNEPTSALEARPE